MTRRIRLRGIVRTDISVDVQRDTEDIDTLARQLDAELEPTLITDSDNDYPLLFALLGSTDVTAVVVPDVRHLSGWLPVLREHLDVWTLRPLRRVPGGTP